MGLIASEILEGIAVKNGLSKDKLIKESLVSFLKEKKRLLQIDKIQILSRYRIKGSEELKKRMENGKVGEHPAWEDLIEVENLEAKLSEVNRDIRTLQKVR